MNYCVFVLKLFEVISLALPIPPVCWLRAGLLLSQAEWAEGAVEHVSRNLKGKTVAILTSKLS